MNSMKHALHYKNNFFKNKKGFTKPTSNIKDVGFIFLQKICNSKNSNRKKTKIENS